jgi:hypothetical protein
VLRFPCLAFLAVLAVGCVTTEELDARLGSWIGADADELAASWGAPTGDYTKKDGGRILTWERAGIATTGVSTFPQAYTRRCRIDVTTDASGKIVATAWQGANDQCSEAIVPRR